ncbi:hypothetical protein AB0J86_14915 [Micromonospora sp. NPDC049559]|uniref:hypothetical protein n=1 Tax=Micromonospora sp. NPDC049559 TaxID=3155923 RepID=UPI00341ECA16
MDRQAAALFGGIVAVGLGPAVWLGGTLARSDRPPTPVPHVTWQVPASPSADGAGRQLPEPPPALVGGVSGEGAGPVPTGTGAERTHRPSPSVSPSGMPTTGPTTAPPSPTARPSFPPLLPPIIRR